MRLYEWTISRVNTDDILLGQVNLKVLIDIFQQVGDILRGRCRMVKVAGAGICSAEDDTRLPGNDEEDALILRLRQNNSGIANSDIFTRENKMNALARLYRSLRPTTGQFLYLPGK